MLYNQPLAIRFGTELVRSVDQIDGIDPYWDTLDIAVAWVRASGMAHLSGRFEHFLRYGGHLSVVVGIDLLNTTREGLQALLDLERHGNAETYVFHNEAGSIFHPKLYLLRNEEEARLIVGSNNLTESGLYMNVEAGLQLDAGADSEVIDQALDALNSWKDTTTGLALRLDAALLARLSTDGYVPDEAAARARQSSRAPSTGRRTPIFGSRRFVPPARPRPPAPPTTAATPTVPTPTPTAPAPTALPATASGTATGTTILMRLRKASVTDRPTQTQIPFRVVDSFFRGATDVRSVHSGERHTIISASARGGRNTVKLEIPEMRDFVEPVARFEQTPQGIEYEVYDVGSPKGNQIKARLEEGRADRSTQMSIQNPTSATWWRFI